MRRAYYVAVAVYVYIQYPYHDSNEHHYRTSYVFVVK